MGYCNDWASFLTCSSSLSLSCVIAYFLMATDWSCLRASSSFSLDLLSLSSETGSSFFSSYLGISTKESSLN
jgi:hypothetical protein